MQKKARLWHHLAAGFLLLAGGVPLPGAIEFPDKNLEDALRIELNIPAGPIYIQNLLDVEVLDLSDYGIIRLDGLDEARNLTELNLSGNNIEILTPLRELSVLRILDLRDNQITGISDLAVLSLLEELDLYGNPVETLDGLSSLENLKRLWLPVGSLADMRHDVTENLNAMSHLTTLSMSGFPSNIPNPEGGKPLNYHPGDLTEDLALADLEEFGIINSTVYNLRKLVDFLKDLGSLKALNLSNDPLEDITPISDLAGLRQLYLFNTNISSIAPLSGLTGLLALSLDYNAVRNVDPLSGMTGLSSLTLSNNVVRDIEALGGMRKLFFLDLSANNIRDISPLTALSKTGFVHLDGNCLDVSKDSEAMEVIRDLEKTGYTVKYDNQRVCPADDYLWADTPAPAGGWRSSAWFGVFSDAVYPLIWHQKHGWLYCCGDTQSSIFFYDYGLTAWTWTSKNIYPWLYLYGGQAGWLWFYENSACPGRRFEVFPDGGTQSETQLRQ